MASPELTLRTFFSDLWTEVRSLQAATTGARRSEVYDATRVHLTNLELDITENISPGQYLVSFQKEQDPNQQDEDDFFHDLEDGEQEDVFKEELHGEQEDTVMAEVRELAELDSDGPLGGGELMIAGQTIPVHDWLGDDRTRMIMDMHHTSSIALPEHLARTPWPWQITGAAKIIYACLGPMKGVINADEMGLGKTTTALLAACAMPKQPTDCFDLILTTKACTHQWFEETQDMFESGFRPRAIVLHDNKTTATDLLAGDFDFVIASWHHVMHQAKAKARFEAYLDAVRNKGPVAADKQALAENLKKQRPILSLFSDIFQDLGLSIRNLIIDEVHNLKKFNGVIPEAVRMLPYRHFIGLSGTPMGTRWNHVFGIVRFFQTEPLQSEGDYYRVFPSEGGRFGEPTNVCLPRLTKYLQSMMFGRPSSLLNLRALSREDVYFLEIEQTEDLIAALMEKYIYALSNASDREGEAVLQWVQFAMMASGHPALLERHQHVQSLIWTGVAKRLKEQFEQDVRRIPEEARVEAAPWANISNQELVDASSATYYAAFATWQTDPARRRRKRVRAPTIAAGEEAQQGQTQQRSSLAYTEHAEASQTRTQERGGLSRISKTSAGKSRSIVANSPGDETDHDDINEKTDFWDADYDPEKDLPSSEGSDDDFMDDGDASDASSDQHDTTKAKKWTAKDEAEWRDKLECMPLEELLSPRVKCVLETRERISKHWPGEKILIWSRFTHFLDIIEVAMKRVEGIECLRFQGGIDEEKRTAARNRFARATNNAPLLITPGAGGVGLNITAASKAIFCESWWTVSDVRQAEFRCHRPGQTKAVHCFTIFGRNSAVDWCIRLSALKKADIVEKFMSNIRRLDEEPPQVPAIIPWYAGYVLKYDDRGVPVEEEGNL